MRRFICAFAIFAAVTACTGEVSGGINERAETDQPGPADDDQTNPDTDDNEPDPIPTALVHYIGRFDTRDSAGPRFAWSGTGLVARFSGTGISITLSGSNNYFATFIDDDDEFTFATNSTSAKTYAIASGLAPGEHIVQVYRRTEAYFGVSQFRGFVVDQGELVPSVAPFEHTIEFVGDSITCGYGNEGPPGCSGNPPQYQNATRAWGSVTAKALSAEASLVAWSGKGMYSNYGGDFTNVMPDLYDRALPEDPASTLQLTTRPPDVVVINLGTNDFSSNHPPLQTGADPSDRAAYIAAYTNAYKNFLTRLRTLYPSAPIFCAVGTMSNAYKTEAQSAIDATGDDDTFLVDLGIQSAPYGCDFHPTAATDAVMGNAMAEVIATRLGWDIMN
jgi:lysophospholipase L1-like esterase